VFVGDQPGKVLPWEGRHVMRQRSDSFTPPEWAQPGNRWGPWLYWPMLCISAALLVWRVSDDAGTGHIVLAAVQTLVCVCLLIANRSARRRRLTQ
jgi:hypothetical protein